MLMKIWLFYLGIVYKNILDALEFVLPNSTYIRVLAHVKVKTLQFQQKIENRKAQL